MIEVGGVRGLVGGGCGGGLVRDLVAMATPLPGSKVVPVPTVEVGSGPSATPTVQVPAGAMMSRHDMIMLFSREVPLAMAKPAAAGAAPGWATKANLAVKTAATDVREATSKFESLFSKILPRGSGENEVTLNASITIQKKLLVLDLTDLLADSGDDLAEVLGQHVSVQLVSTIVDPSAWTSSTLVVSLDAMVSDSSVGMTLWLMICRDEEGGGERGSADSELGHDARHDRAHELQVQPRIQSAERLRHAGRHHREEPPCARVSARGVLRPGAQQRGRQLPGELVGVQYRLQKRPHFLQQRGTYFVVSALLYVVPYSPIAMYEDRSSEFATIFAHTLSLWQSILSICYKLC